MGLNLSTEQQNYINNYKQSMLFLLQETDEHCRLDPADARRQSLSSIFTQIETLNEPVLLIQMALKWHKLCAPATKHGTVLNAVGAMQDHSELTLPSGVKVHDFLVVLRHTHEDQHPNLFESFKATVGWAEQLKTIDEEIKCSTTANNVNH